MTHTIKDLCARYGVSAQTVLSWVRAGELKAVNVGRRLNGKKPRWRVTQESLEAFEALRTPTPPAPRARRRKLPGNPIEFY